MKKDNKNKNQIAEEYFLKTDKEKETIADRSAKNAQANLDKFYKNLSSLINVNRERVDDKHEFFKDIDKSIELGASQHLKLVDVYKRMFQNAIYAFKLLDARTNGVLTATHLLGESDEMNTSSKQAAYMTVANPLNVIDNARMFYNLRNPKNIDKGNEMRDLLLQIVVKNSELTDYINTNGNMFYAYPQQLVALFKELSKPLKESVKGKIIDSSTNEVTTTDKKSEFNTALKDINKY